MSWHHFIGTARVHNNPRLVPHRLGLGPFGPGDDDRIVIINRNNPVNTATCGGGGGQGFPGMPGIPGAAGMVGGILPMIMQMIPGISGTTKKVPGPVKQPFVKQLPPKGVSGAGLDARARRLMRGVKIIPQRPLLRDITNRAHTRVRHATYGFSPHTRTNLGLPMRIRNMPSPRMMRMLGDDAGNQRESSTVIINKIFPQTSSNANVGAGYGGGAMPGGGFFGALPSIIPAVAGALMPTIPPPPNNGGCPPGQRNDAECMATFGPSYRSTGLLPPNPCCQGMPIIPPTPPPMIPTIRRPPETTMVPVRVDDVGVPFNDAFTGMTPEKEREVQEAMAEGEIDYQDYLDLTRMDEPIHGQYQPYSYPYQNNDSGSEMAGAVTSRARFFGPTYKLRR